MKKRILFVDDEPLVLQGLKRLLRPMRDEWDMEFVDSPAQALNRIEQIPFEVVITDMRMPSMNGAQLLTEVMKNHPDTVRFILSGHADQDLIMGCVGTAHQFLSKPCEPDTLTTVISRALNAKTSLDNPTLQNLVSQMNRLPSIPTLYVEITEVIQKPNVSLDEVASIINKDIGMTAKVLQLVNSAFFGAKRSLANTAEAVGYLGIEMIKTLVLSVNAFSQFASKNGRDDLLTKVWNHSLSVAYGARQIAQAENAGKKIEDEAYVGGMLHDIGKVILMYNFPTQYEELIMLVREKDLDLLDAERNVFNATHADVGGYLLGLWGLPLQVVECIQFHHAPSKISSKAFRALTAVQVANALLHEQMGTSQAESQSVDLKYLEEIGLTERLNVWRQIITNKLPTEERL